MAVHNGGVVECSVGCAVVDDGEEPLVIVNVSKSGQRCFANERQTYPATNTSTALSINSCSPVFCMLTW